MQDTYWASPQGTYDERRQAYLDYCAGDSSSGRTGFFSQIARLELGQAVDEQPIRDALDYVYSNKDCNDFTLGGFLRILYKYHDSPHISRDLIADIEKVMLWFRYWWDEPGNDGRCYWTENHQIIFHSCELLAGQLFRDESFDNDGKTGQYHIDHALHYVRRWIDFRVRFGFSEWLSNNYFEEDLLAIVNLYDFAEQDDVRRNAGHLIDIILFEMALHTYRGVMGCTHGRTYPRLIKGGRNEDASNTSKLMFGMGMFNSPHMVGTMCLATSDYCCPDVIEKIASDFAQPRLYKERQSINIEDAIHYGLSYDNADDGHLYWSIQDYAHPTIGNLRQNLAMLHGVHIGRGYQSTYNRVYQWQVEQHGKITDALLDCHAMTEVHIQTYRTGDYMLSSAQDYRAGKPGYQQHIWQATLGIDAVVFTNHPGSEDEEARPNFWAGNCILPRVAQYENVLVCIHHVPSNDPFPYSHAYFPRDAFDEIIEQGKWIFGRKDDGYVALCTQHDYEWHTDKHDDAAPTNEVRVQSPDNIWVVEMGNKARWGDFAKFVDAISAAPIVVDGLSVAYESPTEIEVAFGWDTPFIVKGETIALHNYPRFDNPYCKADFDSQTYHIQLDDLEHTLNFNTKDYREG